MTDEDAFEHANSQWFLCDLRYEGMVGDKMRAAFSVNAEILPHNLAALMQRITEREAMLPSRPPIKNRAHGSFWSQRDHET